MNKLVLELFVEDLDASIDFYRRVLHFTVEESKADGYTLMHNGPVTIALNRHANLSSDHPIHVAAGERPGRGVEIVLEVEDLSALYAHVQAQGWPISSQLQRQPWGSIDFRLQDPDGYYLRFDSSREASKG